MSPCSSLDKATGRWDLSQREVFYARRREQRARRPGEQPPGSRNQPQHKRGREEGEKPAAPIRTLLVTLSIVLYTFTEDSAGEAVSCPARCFASDIHTPN